jgi:hypothetical protein
VTQVWVIEEGEYEQRHVFGVATSPQAAERMIRATYPEPYVVTWEDLKQRGEEYVLVGHFSQVPHCSTTHVAEYDITPHTLDEVEP